ncbi:malonyl CoA-ACP transacylase [Mycolicibacterium wolinskyi]|uniref:Malonyl CoA-ACP transacylase n=1 Tax=Mycolicibacterium wolinskyi TaxID=59750 RepID=A0A1X2F0W3_9MYCO|nr:MULTISPECIES: malonyl CoA-ACP transacylase [Mycolicibacterium]MCV7288262.1 malonyl CoA-ACP transacylase [Mycolicibacterium wolinskyi]MCV7295484.1 malonyl CoA-ACP transacylase [Mycolicibacterium goodii]ORX12081.1 malonyl CoA-ACP transacylase [Mycolicibacterium wolinskyi]
MSVAALVSGEPVLVKEIDEREAQLRATNLASALPRPHTSEGRQLRRWLTQLIVAERVVAAEAAARGLTASGVPAEDTVVPDTAARLEIGSVAASTLADPVARAVFADVTAAVRVDDADVTAYHARNPMRFAAKPVVDEQGWRSRPVEPALDDVWERIAEHLLAAARRRAFRLWLDSRCAELVQLSPGYEHPGDPRQPDNTHKH